MLTVDGEPHEHTARLETALDLIDPNIIKRHPARAALALEVAGLGRFPEVFRGHVAPELAGVPGPAALGSLAPNAEGLGKHGALGRRRDVHVTAEVEDEGADHEDDGGKGVR